MSSETLSPTLSSLTLVLNQYYKDPRILELAQHMQGKAGKGLLAKNLAGSLSSIVAASLFELSQKNFLYILPGKEEAAYFLNDLEALMPDRKVLFYPASYRRPYQVEEVDNANILLRAEVLNSINLSREKVAVVSFPEALFEKVLDQKEIQSSQLVLRTGDTLGIDFLNETLFEYQFERVDFVSEPGEFSIRGGIVDVFSFAHDKPYRIEFLGDEVESIRLFDMATQLSIGTTQEATLMPNMESKTLESKRISLLDYLGAETHFWLQDAYAAFGKLDKLMLKAEEYYAQLKGGIKRSLPNELFLSGDELHKGLEMRNYLLQNPSEKLAYDFSTDFKAQAQPAFHKKFDLLLEYLNGHN